MMGDSTDGPTNKAFNRDVEHFPEVRTRVSRVFAEVRVDWCMGEDPDRWKNHTRHWLEAHVAGAEPIRHQNHGYSSPAYLVHDGQTFVAFTDYWEGEVPCIGQPLLTTRGALHEPSADRSERAAEPGGERPR